MEGLLAIGLEVLASSDMTVTPGFELVTWIFKKSSTPVSPNGHEIVSVVVKSPNRLEIVGPKDTAQVQLVMDRLKQVGVAAWLECWLSHMGVAGSSPGRDNL